MMFEIQDQISYCTSVSRSIGIRRIILGRRFESRAGVQHEGCELQIGAVRVLERGRVQFQNG